MRQLEQPGQESRDISWTMLHTKHPPSPQAAVPRMSLTYRFSDLAPRMSSEALIQGSCQSRVLDRVIYLLVQPPNGEVSPAAVLLRRAAGCMLGGLCICVLLICPAESV